MEGDDILDQIGGADVSVDEVEKRIAASGPIKAGFYRARLNGAKPFEAGTGTKAHELTFLIVGGPYDGREVTDKLWIPSAEKVASAEDKDVRSVGNMRARIAKFGLVLGLLVKDAKGKVSKAEGKTDFIDVLDTDCIVEVTLEADQNNRDKMWPRIAFNGIYRKDDKDAAAKIGKAPTPPRGGSGTAPPEKKEPAAKVGGVKGRI